MQWTGQTRDRTTGPPRGTGSGAEVLEGQGEMGQRGTCARELQGITGVVGHGWRRGGDGGPVVGQVFSQPGGTNVVGGRGRGPGGGMAVPQGRVRRRGEEGERLF